MEVTSIREAKDTTTMTLNELVGNPRAYEMNIDDLKKHEGSKDISLVLKPSNNKGSNIDNKLNF